MNTKQRFALSDLDCVLADIAETEAKLEALRAKARKLEEPLCAEEARLDLMFEKAKVERDGRGG